MKRVIFFTNRLPFPNSDGRKNILFQYINQIKNIYPKVKVINLSFVDEKKHLKKIPDYIDELFILERPNLFEKLFNIIIYSIILGRWPLQVSIFYCRKTKNKVNELIKKIEPDCIVYDMVRVAEYSNDNYTCKKILNYDDLLSLRYSRQIKNIQYTPNLFGGFKDTLPKFINEIFNIKIFQKWLLILENRLLTKYEKDVSYLFDHIVFTSPKEAKQFKEVTNHHSSIGMPMVYKVTDLSFDRTFNTNKIVFLGRMDIPHNISAVLYFHKQIWPIIKKNNPSAEFHVIGMKPVKEIKDLEDKETGIVVTGEVTSISDYLSDAAVFVAPLIYGTGIKTKIIESLALGIPVVSTTIGAEGIPYINKKNLHVTDEPYKFSQYTIELMKNAKKNIHTSKEGKNLIKKHFSIESNEEKWKFLLKN